MKLLFLGCLLGIATAVDATVPDQRQALQKISEINWLTENYPPYNYRENEVITGLSVDVLMAMFKVLKIDKSPQDLTIYPWARSYRHLLNTSGTALFSTTYTPERLKLFKFVGPIMPVHISVIAKKDKGLSISHIEDLNALYVGAVRKDIGEQLLKKHGVNKSAIETRSYAKNIIKMLKADRLDAIAYDEKIAKYHFKILGMDFNNYHRAYLLARSEIGFAFHKDTDQAVIELLQRTLNQLRSDGTLQRIKDKYSVAIE